jgi:hypothetical protein
VWSRTALWTFRIATGVSALGAALILGALTSVETNLVVATAVLGVVVLATTGLDYAWVAPYLRDPPDAVIARQHSAAPGAADGAEVLRDAAKLSISTQGVVLGLFSLSSRDELTVTATVGATALGVGVLVATTLYFLVASGIPDRNRAIAAAYLFNLTFWALGYGLLCIIAWTYSA